MRPTQLVFLLGAALIAAPALAQVPTRTRLISSPDPSTAGQGVMFTAIVDSLGDHIPPINTVTFSDGATVMAAATLRYKGAAQDILALGYLHSCALTRSGGLQCWGANHYGQLGDGSRVNRLTPVSVSGLSSGVAAITAGSIHTCALTQSGGVRCWGWNGYGQLGDGTRLDRLTPVSVSGLSSGGIAIATGWHHTCALMQSGGLQCWGNNDHGQLGDGTATPRLAPVSVSGLSSGVTAIATGLYHTCALTQSGGVKCWGWNGYGQLGDGTTTARLFPTSVTGLASGVAAITAGYGHTCALTQGGGVKCWGRNFEGELGDGTTTNRLIPVSVSGLSSGAMAITAGWYHTCAMTQTGGVKCWGDNRYGQLGDGTTMNRSAPVGVVNLLSGVTAIAAGFAHTCAATISGAMACWGLGQQGQLGDGTGQSRARPVWVSGFLGIARARAQFPTGRLGVGAHAISANYLGEARHAPSADTKTHTVR